jgi:hypothetical protein
VAGRDCLFPPARAFASRSSARIARPPHGIAVPGARRTPPATPNTVRPVSPCDRRPAHFDNPELRKVVHPVGAHLFETPGDHRVDRRQVGASGDSDRSHVRTACSRRLSSPWSRVRYSSRNAPAPRNDPMSAPSVWRDVREHVSAGESMRKQPVEQGVKLPIREARRLTLVGRSLRFPSSGARVQHWTHRRSRRSLRFVTTSWRASLSSA